MGVFRLARQKAQKQTPIRKFSFEPTTRENAQKQTPDLSPNAPRFGSFLGRKAVGSLWGGEKDKPRGQDLCFWVAFGPKSTKPVDGIYDFGVCFRISSSVRSWLQCSSLTSSSIINWWKFSRWESRTAFLNPPPPNSTMIG